MLLILKKTSGKPSRNTFKTLYENFRGHLETVNRHRMMTLRHCIKAGIPLRGLLHDLSKYSPTEFLPGVIYYSGKRSPNEGERDDYGYSKAWMHHKGRNKHHFEYWTDYSPVTKRMSPVKMPLKYVKEMFCDRVAASKIYNGEDYTDSDPLKYYLRAKGRRVIHPETAILLERMLRILSVKGEDCAFDYVRRLRKY